MAGEYAESYPGQGESRLRGLHWPGREHGDTNHTWTTFHKTPSLQISGSFLLWFLILTLLSIFYIKRLMWPGDACHRRLGRGQQRAGLHWDPPHWWRRCFKVVKSRPDIKSRVENVFFFEAGDSLLGHFPWSSGGWEWPVWTRSSSYLVTLKSKYNRRPPTQ